jgi:hypothetical protein
MMDISDAIVKGHKCVIRLATVNYNVWRAVAIPLFILTGLLLVFTNILERIIDFYEELVEDFNLSNLNNPVSRKVYEFNRKDSRR